MHAVPNEVHVRRLQLRGTASQVAQARSGLAAELSYAAWPIVGDDEVLLLRRVRVRAPLGALALEAAAATRALAARAVDPWSPAAAHADALRFASRADYAAWRLHGLLAMPGTHDAARIAAALCEAAAALPAVWRRLREMGGAPALDRLWHLLDAPAAGQVLAAAAAATGWLPALRPRAPQARHDAQDERHAAQALPLAEVLHARIGCPGQPAADARTRLAALLVWWLHAPARLQAADAPEALHAAAVRIAAGAAVHTRMPAPPRRPEPAGAVAPVAEPGPPRTVPTETIVEDTQANVPQAAPASEPAQWPSSTSPERSSRIAPRTAAPMDPQPADGPEPFITRHGGLFWLIQVLALPPCQQRLAPLDEPQAAWREWVRLAMALGAEPDDAWWTFAARRGLLADGDPQAVRRLRWPADVADALTGAAVQRFGDAALHAAIAERPARVVADEARVDVHFRLADAQLEVRRAGLDVDPGWVPWLGCVLRWHFGSALAPQGEGSR